MRRGDPPIAAQRSTAAPVSRRRRATALPSAFLVGAFLVAVASPGHADEPCRDGVSPDAAARIFAALRGPVAETGCVFEGVATERTVLEARWSRDGAVLPPLRVLPATCATRELRQSAARAGRFVVDAPRELIDGCSDAASRVAAVVATLGGENGGGTATGSLDDPLYRGARVLFAAVAITAMALAGRRAGRLGSVDPRWFATAAAAFAAALAVRAALPFSLANWYAEVLPATGAPPWMRFGPGFFAFHSWLRDMGLWSSETLRVTQVCLGASQTLLLVALLRTVRVELEAAAAAAVLLAFSPLHARLSATASEHVLASTLCLGLLVAWLRAARTGGRMWFALTLLLFPAVGSTRVDMAATALLVLPWPLLGDRVESGGLRGRQLGARVAILAAAAAVTLAASYWLIAVPSHHPMPDAAAAWFALRASIDQLWQFSGADPAWTSRPAVVLAAAGAVVMAWRRPLLLLRAAATFFLPFAVLGRPLLSDELLGARYYMMALPILFIASGEGFAAALKIVPGRVRRAAGAVAVVALGLWTAYEGRGAYAVRYAFQDEYTFLRGALAKLPWDCTVYSMPLRVDVFPRDLDCCLDVVRSPLVLDYPRLRLRELPEDLSVVFEDSGCVAYYESAACRIADDRAEPAVHDRADRAADYLHRRCAAAREFGHLQAIAETTVSPRATVDFFRGERPPAVLYRWMR